MRSIPLALIGVLASASLGAQGRPDLSGHWVLKDAPPLDSTASDSAAAPAASGFRPVVRRRGKPEEHEQLRRLIGMAGAVRGFRIAQSDTALSIVNDDGFAYTVHPGSRDDSLVVDDQTIRVRAQWKGKRLEIEYHPPGGGRIVERYALADSGIFLRLEVEIEHSLLAQRLWRPRMYRLQDDP